jgi:hypothetical protein
LGSATVQKPVDLSILIFRQCCAEAIPTSRTSEKYFMITI